ncbi:MAG: hypothetical protein A3K19_15440 [Lentisphaerae bacterium RIFOXYB12_FULL_65_16]|nr:MAG: hypothetical protein A3K18_26505 [Lentisphaerae bacterium RIFOXYA12_64_32]OGV88493.1 MAG: hypothetical protein A3K19_15440 [Lentisphaerae bacterium RIFOXYB12_FULL_65_16]
MTAFRGTRTGWLVMAVAVGLSLQVEAGVLSKIPFFRRWAAENRVESLIVTGNYAKSRLLAEIVQHYTRQPILLISPAASGGYDLFFLPHGSEAVAVTDVKYEEFLDFLNPSRLVLVGDSQYLPMTFLDRARGRHTMVTVNGSDWHNNANAMAGVFKNAQIAETYGDCLNQLDRATAGRPSDR